MSYKNIIAVYIDGINRTSRVAMPLKIGNFLDERLDECHLALRAVEKETFNPLTPVDIVITNKLYFYAGKSNENDRTRVKTRHYVCANDNSDEVQIGTGLYNHDLTLIEVTKVAECIVADTVTFTNDLGRNYTENSSSAVPIWE